MMRPIKQFSFPTTGAEATLSSGTANVEYAINFYPGVDSGTLEVDDNGQFTVAGYVQCSSGTATVTVSYKNMYGTLSEGAYFTLGTISATTAKQYFEYLVHVLKPQSLNTDATGCTIRIARAESVDLLHLGRVVIG